MANVIAVTFFRYIHWLGGVAQMGFDGERNEFTDAESSQEEQTVSVDRH